MKRVAFVVTMLMAVPAEASEPGSLEFCDGLANIGGQTVNARREGHSLSTILRLVNSGLEGKPVKQQYAIGAVTAVYGDRSLQNYDDGYNAVFQPCMSN